MYRTLIIIAALSLCPSLASPLFGAELSLVPFGTRNIVSQAPGGWSTTTTRDLKASILPWGILRGPDDAPAPIDSNGWPLCDAYIVVTLAKTWASVDPSLFLAQYGGNFSLQFQGSATSLIVPPQMNATVSNIEFDNATFTTSLRLFIPQPPPGGEFAIVVGFVGSRRNSTAPLGSGLADLAIIPDSQLQTPGAPPTLSAAGLQTLRAEPLFWGAPLLRTVSPFHHIRTMQVGLALGEWGIGRAKSSLRNYVSPPPHTSLKWTYGWMVTAPFTSPAASALSWADRALMTDSVWQPGYVRPLAFGAPWETVVLLAQESGGGRGVWINVPVQVRCGCIFSRQRASCEHTGKASFRELMIPFSCLLHYGRRLVGG